LNGTDCESMDKLKHISLPRADRLGGLSFLILLTIAIAIQQMWLLWVPAFLLAGLWVAISRQRVYFALFFFLPFSFDANILGDMQLAIPSEVLMILITAMLLIPTQESRIRKEIIQHPLTILILIHLAWILLSTISSTNPLVSGKYFIAKLWFLGAFYLSSWYCLRKPVHFERLWWLFYIPMLLSILYVFIRHLEYNLVFSKVNAAVGLIYQNHVDYGCLMVLFYPLIWVTKRWYPTFSLPGLILGMGLLLFPVAIYFSYTRVAIGLLILYPLIYAILHFRLLRPALIISAIAIITGITYLLSDRTYLKYAPNYDRTIYQDEFGNLLEATYKLEDLSTMERLHRWVAARHMTVDYPWMGTGPGTFHPTYKSYTVKSFATYVSDNPEQSGVHNYFLMTLTDQGWPGLIFWLFLLLGSLLFMDQLYHSGRLRPSDRTLLAALFCMFCGIIVINVLNDMIEHFKIGGLFFWILALVGLLSYGHPISPKKDTPDEP